jgi:serine/threonine protein kinase
VTKKKVAIKFINKASISTRGETLQKKFEFELNVMKRLDHPNIIKIENFMEDEEHYCIILEYANQGNLLELI